MKRYRCLLWLLLLVVGLVGCRGGVVEELETTAVTPTTVADTQPDRMIAGNSMMSGMEVQARQQRPLGTAAPTASAESQPTGKAEQAIALVSSFGPVAEFLAGYPGWTADAYPDDEPEIVWHVDFSATDEEWLGYGHANVQTGEVFDYFVPQDVTPEAYAAGQARIETFLLNDGEVLALLGEFSLWEHDITYNRYDANWEANFWRGLDAWRFVFYLDETSLYLDRIENPNSLAEEEAQRWNHDQAIELAYQAERLDEALAGYDNWTTYAEEQGNGRWTVAFVAEQTPLFAALVDIENWQVLEAGVGD